MSNKSLGRFLEPTIFILISVANHEKHGYGMMEDIKESYGVDIGPGTLYGAISRMEKLGLIEPLPTVERRKPYQITQLGKEFLEERLYELKKVSLLGFERLGLI